MSWIPLGADQASYEQLYETIEPWMRSPLDGWITDRVAPSTRHGRARRPALIEEFDSRLRRAKPLAVGFDGQHGVANLLYHLQLDGDYLDMLDFLLYKTADRDSDEWDEDAPDDLEKILATAGSAWRVGIRNGRAGLERRVSEGVQEAAELAMRTPGHAGVLLSEAWHAAFGQSPDYEKAYAKSIKAVEAAAIPVVQPNHSGATLGTVVGQMRGDADWKLAMTREHPSDISVVLAAAQTLWTGQNDRHAGQPGYAASTQAEAEAAVFLAVPLVQWFSSGSVARR